MVQLIAGKLRVEDFQKNNKWVKSVYIDKKPLLTTSYALYKDIMLRATNPWYKKRNPAYEHTTVSDNFSDYQFFAQWCQNQIGYNFDNYHLDKDILCDGKSVYQEQSSVFIPRHLNIFLTNHAKARGVLPQGMFVSKSKIRVVVRNREHNIKITSNFSANHLDLAMEMYKLEKTKIGRILAKDLQNGKYNVDERVIDYFSNYTFEYSESDLILAKDWKNKYE